MLTTEQEKPLLDGNDEAKQRLTVKPQREPEFILLCDSVEPTSRSVSTNNRRAAACWDRVGSGRTEIDLERKARTAPARAGVARCGAAPCRAARTHTLAEPLFGERDADEAVVHEDAAAYRHAPARAPALKLPCVQGPRGLQRTSSTRAGCLIESVDRDIVGCQPPAEIGISTASSDKRGNARSRRAGAGRE